MGWLRAILSELLGLFVEDAGFALAILAWIGISHLLLRLVPAWVPLILFLGLAVILVQSAIRRARQP